MYTDGVKSYPGGKTSGEYQQELRESAALERKLKGEGWVSIGDLPYRVARELGVNDTRVPMTMLRPLLEEALGEVAKREGTEVTREFTQQHMQAVGRQKVYLHKDVVSALTQIAARKLNLPQNRR